MNENANYDIKNNNEETSQETHILIKNNRRQDKNVIIPSLNELSNINLIKYQLPELKKICRFYKITNYSKMNKSKLIGSIEHLIKVENYICMVQKNIKRFNIQRFLNNKAPNKSWLPSNRKSLCKNESDFYTLELVEDIPLSQYICYVDENECYWGFNIISLYNYFEHQYHISKIKNKINNPYTNLPFNIKFIENFNHHIYASKIYGFTVELQINKDEENKNEAQTINNLLIHNISIIEQHGYFIRNDWITSISKEQLINFVYELKDIWTYRSQIDDIVKKQICYPSGNPFENIASLGTLNTISYNNVFQIVLNIINNFISKGVTYSDCETGILFVLSALSLVSSEFANAYPWIFAQSHY